MRLAVSDKLSNTVKVSKHPGTGYRFITGTLTRPGIFRYQVDDGSWINAVRLPAEVHSPDYLATIGGSALMLDHPEKTIVEPGDPIDGMLIQGQVADHGGISFSGWITSAEAIAAVDSGIRQISACFTPDWVDMDDRQIAEARLQFPSDAALCDSGRWMYHKNLVNNHGAIVEVGRVSGAALDSASFIKEVGMGTKTITVTDEEAQEILAIVEDEAETPVMGGIVSTTEELPCEAEKPDEMHDEEPNMAELAKNMLKAAMAMTKAALAHGIKLDAEEIVSDSAKAADQVIAHFGASVPAVMDSAEGRLALADILLSQKVATVADSEDIATPLFTEIVETVADSAQAKTIHDIYDRIAAAANKV
jgi:hypothetical protein